jgi:hypothetical protein
VAVVLQPIEGAAQQNSNTSKTSPQRAPTERDGQHDFDFQIGTWKTHVKRLVHPLTGSTTWAEYDGSTAVRKIWNGRANLSELEADGPAGHLENLSLRLYNPESHQWSLNYANSRGGAIDVPFTVGQFKSGRGEFFDMEPINGRNTLVRNVWSDITPTSCRFEQAFSQDAGNTWEVNWIATNTRMEGTADVTRPEAQSSASEGDGQHDFDFNIGTWKTHQSRLMHPLTGSHTWVEYDGTDMIRKIWGGRANMGEIETNGPAGHLELLSLRLYNAQAHQWSFNVANSTTGTLSPPAIGEFKNGRAEFVDQEPYNGRTILVRFSVFDITPNSCRFEQAFSDDGGKTWEVNFIVTETRVTDQSDKTG